MIDKNLKKVGGIFIKLVRTIRHFLQQQQFSPDVFIDIFSFPIQIQYSLHTLDLLITLTFIQNLFQMSYSISYNILIIYFYIIQYKPHYQRIIMKSKKKSTKNISTVKTSQITQISYNREPSLRKLSFFDKSPGIVQKNNNSLQFNKKYTQQNSSKPTMKQLEALQKKAIKLFYQKNFQETFYILRQCSEIIEKIDSIQHKIYINYIYTQIFFKLKQYQDCLQHYQYAKVLYQNSSNSQQKNLHSYIMNLECLHLSILFQMNNYDSIVQRASQLIINFEKGSASWLQCQSNKMKALMELQQYQEAIQTGFQLVQGLNKQTDKIKYILKVSICMEKCGKTQNAIQMIEKYLINFNQVNKDQKYTTLYHRIAQLSLSLDDQIKTIFCLQKIKRSNIPNKQEIQTCRMLAKLYNQIGDHQKCVQNCQIFYDIISDLEQTIIYSDSLNRIGCNQQAIEIYTKFLQVDRPFNQKCKIYIKLMEILQENDLQAIEEKFIEQTQRYKNNESIIGITEYANLLRKNEYFSKSQSFYKHAANLAYLSKLPQYLFAIYFNLGQMLEQLERKNESLVYYSKAVKLNVQHELLEDIRLKIKRLKEQI